MQRGVTGADGIGISAFVEEERRNVPMPAVGGKHQRAGAIGQSVVGICAGGEQYPGRPNVPDTRGEQQRGAATSQNCVIQLLATRSLSLHPDDVKAKETAHDETALMWAVAQSQSDVVQLLVETGADMRARSRTYPQTVVGVQTQRAGREELNYTVLRGGSTPLLFAARVGNVRSARILLAAGADANDALPDGTSALVLAAHSGHGDVAALLLDKGADPNAI